MRLTAVLACLLLAAACTHTRDNPCDEEGMVFDPSIFGSDVREEDFEMGWVRNIAGEMCGNLIDRYEASHRDASTAGDDPGSDTESNPRSLAGYLPWTNVKFEDAKKACEGKPESPYKRICKKSEFILACRGGYINEPDPLEGENEEQDYPYGGDYLKSKCNGAEKWSAGETAAALPTGSMSECFTEKGVLFATGTTAGGLYDLSGNVMEWVEDDETGEGVAIGGSFKSVGKDKMACDYVDTSRKPNNGYDDVGFRCCK